MTAPNAQPAISVMLHRELFTYNVVVSFVFKLSVGLAYGVWSSGQVSLWISKLYENSSEKDPGGHTVAAVRVGVVSFLTGMVGVVAALPAGWLADFTRRDYLLKACGATSLVAIFFYSVALLLRPVQWAFLGMSELNKYVMWCVGAALWGLTTGLSTVNDALLADSVPTGGRSTVYTALYASTLLMSMCGPLFDAVMFLYHGNNWSLRTLQTVMLVGMGLQIIPGIAAFFFDDDKTLGHEADALLEEGDSPREPLLNGYPRPGGQDSDSDFMTESMTEEECDDGEQETGEAEEEGQVRGGGAGACTQQPRVRFGPTQDHAGRVRARDRWSRFRMYIPVIITLSDVLYGLASGMTIKFFPLFFKDVVMLSPAFLHFVLAGQPLCIAIGSIIVRSIAHVVGRVQTILFFKFIGVTLMALMALMGIFGGGVAWKMATLMVPIFLVRTSVNNACNPLSNSILMDFLPKERRGRWNSLNSIISWGWAGSALIGGYLIQKYGYTVTFGVTAVVQLMAWLVLVPLVLVVPRRECGFTSHSSMDPLPDSDEETASMEDGEGCSRQPTPRMRRVDSNLSMSFWETAEAEKGKAVSGFDDG
eukprot:jgi/Botrbrau1/2840/Bobra.0125s0047.1